jgi:hypothetical protein
MAPVERPALFGNPGVGTHKPARCEGLPTPRCCGGECYKTKTLSHRLASSRAAREPHLEADAVAARGAARHPVRGRGDLCTSQAATALGQTRRRSLLCVGCRCAVSSAHECSCYDWHGTELEGARADAPFARDRCARYHRSARDRLPMLPCMPCPCPTRS